MLRYFRGLLFFACFPAKVMVQSLVLEPSCSGSEPHDSVTGHNRRSMVRPTSRQVLTAVAIALSIAALSASQAQAVPMSVDCGFGPTSCIVDPDTNLKWLQPNVTANLSVNQVTTLLGTTYSGFVYANIGQVSAFLDLMSLNLGLLEQIPGGGSTLFALYDDGIANSRSSIYAFSVGTGAHLGSFFLELDGFASPGTGSALLMSLPTSVPEPSALSLMLFGGIAVLASRWHRRKPRSSELNRNRQLA